MPCERNFCQRTENQFQFQFHPIDLSHRFTGDSSLQLHPWPSLVNDLPPLAMTGLTGRLGGVGSTGRQDDLCRLVAVGS